MAEKLVYLSEEWRVEAEKRLKETLPPDKMNHITSSMTNIYKNCPGGKEKYFYFNYVKGKLVNLEIGEGKPPAAEFTITGNYDIFAKVTKQEMGSQRALMTGKVKLRGNLVKALKLAAVSDRIQKVLSSIPAVY